MDIIIQFVLSVSWNILLVMFSTAKSSDSGEDIVGFGFFTVSCQSIWKFFQFIIVFLYTVGPTLRTWPVIDRNIGLWSDDCCIRFSILNCRLIANIIAISSMSGKWCLMSR